MFSQLHAHISASSGITDLVSTRIYPMRLPQDPTYPAVVYERVSGTGGITHSGDTGLREWRVRIACYDDNLQSAESVLTAIRDYLHGTQATVSGILFGGFDVNEGPTLYEDEADIYGTSLDVSIQWKSV